MTSITSSIFTFNIVTDVHIKIFYNVTIITFPGSYIKVRLVPSRSSLVSILSTIVPPITGLVILTSNAQIPTRKPIKLKSIFTIVGV